MKDLNVLMTGAGAPGAPSIIKCLRKNGERSIRIVGVDMNEKSNGRRLVDVFYQVPPAGDEHYIDAILEICDREKIDIVMPLVTRELVKYAQSRQTFAERGIILSVDDVEELSVINNKANLLLKMRELGMETPDFKVVNTADELEKAVYELGYPHNAVCVKGAEGNGSRGVRILDPKKSLYDLFFNEKPNSMYISINELLGVLREKDQIPQMVVTMGVDGAVFAEKGGGSGFCASQKVDVIDTTGAGDAFFSGVTIGLTYGKSLAEACEIGTRLAISVISTKESVCPRFRPEEFGLSVPWEE